jgi:hypothetical protein
MLQNGNLERIYAARESSYVRKVVKVVKPRAKWTWVTLYPSQLLRMASKTFECLVF